MADNSCALLFSLKSSPAARIILLFPFDLCGVKRQLCDAAWKLAAAGGLSGSSKICNFHLKFHFILEIEKNKYKNVHLHYIFQGVDEIFQKFKYRPAC